MVSQVTTYTVTDTSISSVVNICKLSKLNTMLRVKDMMSSNNDGNHLEMCWNQEVLLVVSLRKLMSIYLEAFHWAQSQLSNVNRSLIVMKRNGKKSKLAFRIT
jgi:hypothetical protein